jgi:hypothetical protein
MGSPPGLLQARRLGDVDLEALLAALVAAGHFSRGMPKLALDMGFVDIS